MRHAATAITEEAIPLLPNVAWSQPTTTSTSRVAAFIRDYAVDLAILVIAYLIATYFRQTLPVGKFVGENYDWFAPGIYGAIALGAGIAHLALLAPRLSGRLGSRRGRLAAAVLALLGALLALTVLMPLQSGLQKGYFFGAALILILLIVPVPAAAHSDAGLVPLGTNLARLWANRSLLRIWVQYNVQSRYAQAFLGILWIILLPLSNALVMNIVFAELLRVPTGDAPYISFLLAGIVPWGLFGQAIAAGMRSILGVIGLINQIYFPREIIVLSALGEALVDAFFMFLVMLVINGIVGVVPNALFIYLPILIIIQVSLTLGLMFVVSWFSVLVRDVPQLVSVMLQMLFYLCPIIYPLSVIPERFRPLIMLNPLAALIEAYRGILIYQQQPDLLSLVYPAALGVGALIFGYRLFKANEDRFADMV